MRETRKRIDSVRLEELDRALLESYGQTWETGAAKAGPYLTCRVGCTQCCVGVFEITGLDAWRLRRGLRVLATKEPQLASRVRQRAQEQWRLLQDHFPGDKTSGAFATSDDKREAFCHAFAHLPCPALEPSTGRCLLYEARPLSCRSFGLPCRWGTEPSPPCPLNFLGASPEAVAAATVTWDPQDLEGVLLHALGNPPDTVVAAALSVGPEVTGLRE